MKKETLEEASERAVKSGLFKDKTLFIAGAKWQQERSYIDEATEKYSNMQEDVSENIGKYLVKAVFKDGAYWNQEKIYNEIKELYDNENITGFSKLAYAKCLDIIKNK